MIIIDSSFASLEEAIQGTKAPPEVISTLALINVAYVSFDGLMHAGQLVMHTGLVRDVEDAFALMRTLRFPIAKVRPVVVYGWDDEASMDDNNSSGFNYRFILDTNRLSNHSLGCALDLNPRQNPYRSRSQKIYPSGAVYDPSAQGTLLAAGEIVRFFEDRGWEWGGTWTTVLDYHHFEKPQP